MALEQLALFPGIADINRQFEPGPNLTKTYDYYNRIKDPKTDDYEFGELTNLWYNAGPGWMRDAGNYPAKDQIKQCIIKALNSPGGPVPVRLHWGPGPNGSSARTMHLLHRIR
jgi:hypothetical protein